MATIKGKPKKQTSFKLTQNTLDKIDGLVKSGAFPNNTSVVEAALQEFFTRRESQILIQSKDTLNLIVAEAVENYLMKKQRGNKLKE